MIDDRADGSKYGRAAFYIRDSIQFKLINRMIGANLFEYVCVEVKLPGSNAFSIVTLYRTNSKNSDPI